MEKTAIERLKMASEMSLTYYGKPLICTYSGGKDSDVMLELFKRSGIPFEAHNSHTTVDAPQTVYHIRKKFYELELQGIKATIQYPKLSMWQLIVKNKIPPLRQIRYCCQELKESQCGDRMIATGVRWDESTQRKNRGVLEDIAKKKKDRIILMNDNDDKRQLIERCELKAKTVCNPIIDWKYGDIWGYIRAENITVNPLYDMGFERVGCIGCPMANLNQKKRQFALFPKYKQNYIRAFDRMLKVCEKPADWKTGEDVFRWWIEDDEIRGQEKFEFEEGEND